MANVPVTLSIRRFEYLIPLLTGEVKPEGVDLDLRFSFDSLKITASDSSVDGGESSLGRYIFRMARGDDSIMGLPVFVMRGFRHRTFYVRRESSIQDLADLAGKTVGTNEWPATGNTWARAAIRERGVEIDRIRWLVGRVSADIAMLPPDALPPGVEQLPPERPLDQLMLAGEIDAIMAPWPPSGFYEPGSPFRRVYEDFRTAERDYYRRTGVFPNHHLVILKRPLVERHPWVVRSLFRAFEESSRLSRQQRWEMPESPPWLMAELEETHALMGEDYMPFGIEKNRRLLATLAEEQRVQGLAPRALEVDRMFAEFTELERRG